MARSDYGLGQQMEILKPFRLMPVRLDLQVLASASSIAIIHRAAMCRCRACVAHTRQSKPDSGLGVKAKVLENVLSSSVFVLKTF